MQPLQIIIYVFAASFIFMAAALRITYRRTRHHGVLLLAITYAAAAILAVALTHWWPLVAGFALVWALRLMGLDPDVHKNDKQNSAEEKK